MIPSSVEAPVVFPNRMLGIADLADGFTRSVRTKKQIEERAKEFGIESATLMIGLEASLQSPEKLCPKGLTYLGLFEADEGHDYVDEDPSKQNSLYWAIIEGDLAVAKLILKSNPASVYEKNHVGHTPLMASATTERPDITDLLLESGARVDEVTPDNSFNALHWALHHHPQDQRAVLRVVELLVGHGADVNAVGETGITPLMLAAWFGAEPTCAFLLRHGADTGLRDAKRRTARDMASERGHTQIVELLQKLTTAD
jgi:hypothetical protein